MSRDRGQHVQFFIKDPLVRERLKRVVARIPYDVGIATIAERGVTLALDELEKAWPEQPS